MRDHHTSDVAAVRWASEIALLYTSLGCVQVEFAGTNDYQGCGTFLFSATDGDYRPQTKWLVVDFSYGSCSGCDKWEDASKYVQTRDWLALAEEFKTEAEGRAAYAAKVAGHW